MSVPSSFSIDLAQILVSRLCHELISPAGAIANGVELIQEFSSGQITDPMAAEAFSLIASSSKEATKRLKFYRLAYGSAGRSGSITTSETYNLLKEFFADNEKIKFTWNAVVLPDYSSVVLQVFLNLVLLASDQLIRGGTITIQAEDDAADIVIQGTHVKDMTDVLAILGGAQSFDQMNSRNIHVFWVLVLANAAKISIDARVDAGQAIFHFKI